MGKLPEAVKAQHVPVGSARISPSVADVLPRVGGKQVAEGIVGIPSRAKPTGVAFRDDIRLGSSIDAQPQFITAVPGR